MPKMSGIDAALLRMNGKLADDPRMGNAKAEAPKKAAIGAATVDLEAEGLEGCKKRVADMEIKIGALQDKIGSMPPTKQNKPKIAELKKQVEELQRDPNYRGALTIVRQREEEDREKRRGDRDKEDEVALMGGLPSKKGTAAAPETAKPKGGPVAAVAVDVPPESFEADAEVVGVVASGCQGAPLAIEQLAGGPGIIEYKSDVKEEIASMVFATQQQLGTALKRASGRDGTLRTIRALLWNSPAVLTALPTILGLLEESNLKSEPGMKAHNLAGLMCKGGPNGKAIPELILPVLMAHTGAAAGGKWKVKVGCLSLLRDVLKHMGQAEVCPLQLGLMMPQVTTALRSAVGDARKDVKKAAEEFLVHIGEEMANTPEIKNVKDELIASIIDSANMQKASDIMNKLGNTTFMNTVDAASFALLFPIVSRAMKENDHDARKKAVQMVGAFVNLIASPEFLTPYLPELIPLLQENLAHASADVEREAAKAFGLLGAGLPRLCDEEIVPYLLEQLQSNNTNEDVSEVDRRGAAHGLSEVMIKRPDLIETIIHGTVLPRIATGATAQVKAGALAVFQFFPYLAPSVFLPHLKRSLPFILQALRVDSEVVTKQARHSMDVLVQEYGSTCPGMMLPPMQDSLFFEEEDAQDFAMQAFFALGEKIQDAVKFGQDFTSVEVLNPAQRKSLLSSIYIARSDPNNHAVRRNATLLWKEKVKSGQKARAEILPMLLRLLKGLQESGQETRVASVTACLAELVAAGDVQANVLDDVEPMAFFSPAVASDAGEQPLELLPPPPPTRMEVLKAKAQDNLKTISLPAPLRKYIEAVLISSCIESRTEAQATEAIETELRPLVAAKVASALEHFGLKVILPKIFEGVHDVVVSELPTERNTGDYLLRVENLMLMYGAGHTLLKDATLELMKGHTYGVVGRNGAGKTTLMSTLASGNVVQIPKWVRMLHVRPEVLVEALEMSAVQFCRKHSPEVAGNSDDKLHTALAQVGFPDEMQHKCVSELSGGWRMKLLIASAMMRDCDLLLLDEPTNHLDTDSVAWLVSYIRSLTKSTVMVISHDPTFLNAVCTDIIQYSSQKTLEYYKGNFESFREQRNIISGEEAEALLLGNDMDDIESDLKGEAKKVEGEEKDEDETLGLKANLLDKSAKITFPIPGKLAGHTLGKPVMELRNVWFSYTDDGDDSYTLENLNVKVGTGSRIGIVGRNGAGKTTMLNLLCGDLQPSPPPGDEKIGEVYKHRNLRLSYISQDHMYHISEFLNSSPYVYTQRRFQNGWDEALQQRLMNPQTEEEASYRKEMAGKLGKYGKQVKQIVGRQVRANETLYEVEWTDLDDPKQNTYEPISKLKKMGVLGFAKAFDERLAAQAAGIDRRPLTAKEIVKHYEQFGLEEELVMNRNIGTFSAGQRSKLTLGGACWTKPHVIALDEPTNYIDMETLGALAKSLNRYKGAVLVISHSEEFVSKVCDETWSVADKKVVVNKAVTKK